MKWHPSLTIKLSDEEVDVQKVAEGEAIQYHVMRAYDHITDLSQYQNIKMEGLDN